jgi:hypothetical protein
VRNIRVRPASDRAIFVFFDGPAWTRKTSEVNLLLNTSACEGSGGLVKIHHFRVKIAKAVQTAVKGNSWARKSANYRASA